MQKVYDDVLIFCPEIKTGGPEALHQLAYQITCHGGSARMVYYAPFSRIEVDDGVLRCHADASPMPAHFARYHPRVLTEARLGPGTLVVFPEPLSHFAAKADVAYQRALWWLSLDNGVPQNPGLAEGTTTGGNSSPTRTSRTSTRAITRGTTCAATDRCAITRCPTIPTRISSTAA